jgi:hypothetical protein
MSSLSKPSSLTGNCAPHIYERNDEAFLQCQKLADSASFTSESLIRTIREAVAFCFVD